MALYRVRVVVEATTYAADDAHARDIVEQAIRVGVSPMAAAIEGVELVSAVVDDADDPGPVPEDVGTPAAASPPDPITQAIVKTAERLANYWSEMPSGRHLAVGNISPGLVLALDDLTHPFPVAARKLAR